MGDWREWRNSGLLVGELEGPGLDGVVATLRFLLGDSLSNGIDAWLGVFFEALPYTKRGRLFAELWLRSPLSRLWGNIKWQSVIRYCRDSPYS